MTLRIPNEKHPDERDILSNHECLEEARSPFKYADLEGYRGSPHKLLGACRRRGGLPALSCDFME
jgi:hypothetical protein